MKIRRKSAIVVKALQNLKQGFVNELLTIYHYPSGYSHLPALAMIVSSAINLPQKIDNQLLRCYIMNIYCRLNRNKALRFSFCKIKSYFLYYFIIHNVPNRRQKFANFVAC
jgi:hypothetical protein